MRVIDRGDDARFFLKLGALFGVGAAFLLQNLEGYFAIEIQVDGLVDRAHPSFAQQFQQPIIIKLAVGTQALPTTRATDLRKEAADR